MTKLKKGLHKTGNKVRERTSAYSQFGARHGMATKRNTKELPHKDSTYNRKGRVDSDNSTAGNRSFR